MKLSAYPALLLLTAAGLSGCPLYDHEDAGCYSDRDCASGYSCDDRNGLCYPEESDACRKPSDCGTNETCSRFGACTAGDCHYESVGCVRGYECSSDSGRWECVSSSEAGAGGSANEGGAGGSANEGGASGGVGAGGEGGALGGAAGGSAGAPP